MSDHKSVVHLALISFFAAASRELSVLPPNSERQTSWRARSLRAAIGSLVELTTSVGLVVTNFLRLLEPNHRSLASGADAQPPEVAERIGPELRDGNQQEQAWDRSLADRKLWLLKRSGLFGSDTKGVRIGRACTVADLRKAYKLVHDIYLGRGFIDPEPAGMRLRIFETTPDMATFVAKLDNGQVVGVLSIVADGEDFGLPSDVAFKAELDQLRATGARLCEATNQAVAEEYRKSAVPTELMRCAVAHFIRAGFDETIATVSPSHNSFYELLGFREIGGERSYSKEYNDPVVALSMDVEHYRRAPIGLNETEQFVHRFLAGENPYITRVAEWAKQARRQFLDADLLSQLFVTERNFIKDCSPAELAALHRRWGSTLFSEVAGSLFIPSTQSLLDAAMPSLAQRPSPGDSGAANRDPQSSSITQDSVQEAGSS